MPSSLYNVGLYTRFGFNSTYPTLYLSKNGDFRQMGPPFLSLSQLEDHVALPIITQVSGSVWSQVDYALEARNAKEYGWGDSLLVGWPNTWAVAIIRTVPRTEGDELFAETSMLAVLPEARFRIEEAVQAIQVFARSRNLSPVVLPVNAADAETLQRIMACGFRVKSLFLRMIFRQAYPRPRGIDLARWPM